MKIIWPFCAGVLLGPVSYGIESSSPLTSAEREAVAMVSHFMDDGVPAFADPVARSSEWASLSREELSTRIELRTGPPDRAVWILQKLARPESDRRGRRIQVVANSRSLRLEHQKSPRAMLAPNPRGSSTSTRDGSVRSNDRRRPRRQPGREESPRRLQRRRDPPNQRHFTGMCPLAPEKSDVSRSQIRHSAQLT